MSRTVLRTMDTFSNRAGSTPFKGRKQDSLALPITSELSKLSFQRQFPKEVRTRTLFLNQLWAAKEFRARFASLAKVVASLQRHLLEKARIFISMRMRSRSKFWKGLPRAKWERLKIARRRRCSCLPSWSKRRHTKTPNYHWSMKSPTTQLSTYLWWAKLTNNLRRGANKVRPFRSTESPLLDLDPPGSRERLLQRSSPPLSLRANTWPKLRVCRTEVRMKSDLPLIFESTRTWATVFSFPQGRSRKRKTRPRRASSGLTFRLVLKVSPKYHLTMNPPIGRINFLPRRTTISTSKSLARSAVLTDRS